MKKWIEIKKHSGGKSLINSDFIIEIECCEDYRFVVAKMLNDTIHKIEFASEAEAKLWLNSLRCPAKGIV